MGSDEGVSSRTGMDGIGSTTSTTASITKSWAPEDYPDPWINPSLCMGAASSSPPQNNPPHYYDAHVERQRLRGVGPVPYPRTAAAFQQRTTLFCDPDRVLDGETIRDVVERLRSFASTFASSSSPLRGMRRVSTTSATSKRRRREKLLWVREAYRRLRLRSRQRPRRWTSKDVAMDSGYDDGIRRRGDKCGPIWQTWTKEGAVGIAAIHGEGGVKGSSPPSLIPSFQGFFVNA